MMDRQRVLILNRRTAELWWLRSWLKKSGVVVSVASDLADAAVLLEKGEYRIVLADMELLSTGGAAALALLRTIRERHPGTVVVLLPFRDEPDFLETALGLGTALVSNRIGPLITTA